MAVQVAQQVHQQVQQQPMELDLRSQTAQTAHAVTQQQHQVRSTPTPLAAHHHTTTTTVQQMQHVQHVLQQAHQQVGPLTKTFHLFEKRGKIVYLQRRIVISIVDVLNEVAKMKI